MNKHCRQWEDQLIELADGELPPEQQATLQSHVDACPGCRDLLRRLHVSLELAVTTWQDENTSVARSSVARSDSVARSASVARSDSVARSAPVGRVSLPTASLQRDKPTERQRSSSTRMRQVFGRKTFGHWGAAVVLVAATCGLWFWGLRSNDEPGRQVVDANGEARGIGINAEPSQSQEADLTIEEIEEQIARQQHAAILRALNKMLADTPGTEAVQAGNREMLDRLSGG